MSESSEEEREEEQATVLPTPLRRSVSVGGQENENRTSVLRALWAQQHQEEQKDAEERFAAEQGDEDDEDEEDEEDDEDGSEEDEGADQGDRVKTEPGFEQEADAARYRRELEERYAAEVARARWMSSGGQSYGGYGGAYNPPPAEYGGYGRAREETPPGRRPSGFIPVYTGAEVRRSDSPAYGWNQTAWPVPPREPLRPFGWTPAALCDADDGLAEPKDGDEVKECPVVGVGAEVKESPVVRVDETEGVAVLKEVVACPEANEFVEEKADDKLKESIDQVEIVIAVNETVAEELKEGVGVSVPEPEDGSGLRTVLDEGDKAELAGETVPDGADEVERGCVREKKKNMRPENEMNAKETEAVVYSNIGVPAIDGSREDSAVKNRAEGEEPTVETSPLVIRALGRRAVYEWLKKVRNEGTPLEPSHRDQVPEVDWVQLLAVTAELTKRDSVPLPDWVTFSEWVECNHSKCGELV
ncbi:hypothetical protein PF008_g21113 [Phytophthora fragariae]|uniref:Uncharacterized protein n=1 Tax=Phytophthora fragariae TaxID=53985 RepID=A0A6G0QXI1_9STRA|nr:hypothetical protein PF008_g21113 [Phytophthora fragariae]